MHNNLLLHLSLIDGIGPATVQTLIERTPRNCVLEDLYKLSGAELRNTFGCSQGIAQKIVTGLADNAKLERELQLIEKHHINWTSCNSSDYPSLLKEIHVPPIIIYWQGGDLSNSNSSIAIIGSRKANRYGQRVIHQLVPTLVAHEFTIVSGGALGADSMAHQATIDAGGKTVVVLGSGLLKPYPVSNRKLFENVLATGGTLVSTFPLTMEAMPGNFPARNRIIAGLSRGCVVIQAAKKSGASITANYALEQGREVFAVPGPIDDELSHGCHALVKQGATIVSSAQDILDEMGYTSSQPPIDQKLVSLASPQAKARYASDSPEGRILDNCSQGATLDELEAETGLEVPQLNAVLFDLQLEGVVVQNGAGLWEAT